MANVRILAISSGRADVGVIGPAWRAIGRDPYFELHILFTGMHMPQGGLPKNDSAIPARATLHVEGADLGGREPLEAALAMAKIHDAAAQLCDRLKPDILLVVGDRLDMLPAATGALAHNIPIAHIGGGDLSLGAVDDRNRHALSKLSHLHFVLSTDAASRLTAMGEEPWRVHVTGAPNLDTLVEAPILTAAQFAGELNLQSETGIRLVTIHPETNAERPDALLEPILAALDKNPGATLITASNADPGGSAINARLREFAAARDWVVFRDTLGGRLYPNALRHAAVMVGNSSSGIIEAGLFGLQVINIGTRQMGRLRGSNVHDVKAEAATIAEAITRLSMPPGRAERGSVYGDGRAGARVAEVLRNLPSRRDLLAKQFCESRASFTAPWEQR